MKKKILALSIALSCGVVAGDKEGTLETKRGSSSEFVPMDVDKHVEMKSPFIQTYYKNNNGEVEVKKFTVNFDGTADDLYKKAEDYLTVNNIPFTSIKLDEVKGQGHDGSEQKIKIDEEYNWNNMTDIVLYIKK